MHIKTVHEGQKGFVCNKCGKAFGEKSVLNTHIKVVHEGRKDFVCEECGETFGQKSRDIYFLKSRNMHSRIVSKN